MIVEYVGERHSDLGDVECKYMGELRYALTFRSAEGKRRFELSHKSASIMVGGTWLTTRLKELRWYKVEPDSLSLSLRVLPPLHFYCISDATHILCVV
jgi:hypothetical protein